MRYLLVVALFFSYSFADLDSLIYSNAQTVCFMKNPSNGLYITDYDPLITGQTLRQTIESYHSSTQSDYTCDSWMSDPYVSYDSETYQVIANMDCTVHTELVEEYDGTVSYYWTVINQYSLDVDCRASCEVPRDDNGNIYDFTPYISETDCTVENLQQLVLAEDPDSLYIIVDAQYLNCTSNANLTGCFYKKTINFDGDTDNNTTDNNTTDNNTTDTNNTNIVTPSNLDLTDTNEKLDSIGSKIDANGQKIDALGTKLDDLGTKIDSNGEKIDNLGVKIDANGQRIDAVRDSVIGIGNYLGNKLDSMGNSITDELKFQGDRLHDDLQSLQSEPSDGNGSSGFDDTGIIDAIHKNTEAIKEIKDMNEGEAENDASFLDNFQTYYDDMTNSIQNVENNVNDLMATIQGNYTPQFQNHNSCTITFPIMGKSKSVDMCRYSYMLRPFFTFILTIVMFILLIRLHFYLFPKVYKSD